MFTAMVHIVLDHVITPGGWIEPQSLPVHSILRTSAILFQQHHQDPSTLWKKGTTWDLVGQTTHFWPLPALLGVYNTMRDTPSHYITGQVTFALSALLCQLLHREAHYSNHHPTEQSVRMTVNRLLQRLHLTLPPESHRKHHDVGDFSRNFGIVNGWSHPVVNTVYRILRQEERGRGTPRGTTVPSRPARSTTHH